MVVAGLRTDHPQPATGDARHEHRGGRSELGPGLQASEHPPAGRGAHPRRALQQRDQRAVAAGEGQAGPVGLGRRADDAEGRGGRRGHGGRGAAAGPGQEHGDHDRDQRHEHRRAERQSARPPSSGCSWIRLGHQRSLSPTGRRSRSKDYAPARCTSPSPMRSAGPRCAGAPSALSPRWAPPWSRAATMSPTTASRHPGRRRERGVQVLRFGRLFEDPRRHELHFGVRMLPRLAPGEFDVVHSFGVHDAAASILAKRLRRHDRLTVFTDLGNPDRGWWRTQGFVQARRWPPWWPASTSTPVLAVRPRHPGFQLRPPRWPRLPGGVELDAFVPGQARQQRPTILFSGAFAEPRKGVAECSRRCRSSRPQSPRCWLWLSGPGDAGPLLAAAPEEARRGVRVLGLGDVDRQDERYGRAWVTCLPSTDEAFGLALLESLACGTPVVATTHAAPRELVREGVTGELCPPHDPQALAAACLRALALARRPGSSICAAHRPCPTTSTKPSQPSVSGCTSTPDRRRGIRPSELAPADPRQRIRPPATAGRIVTSSPSLTAVSEAVEEEDVLAVDVDVDEPAPAAVLGDPAAQFGEALVGRVEHFPDGRAGDGLADDSASVAARSWVGIFTLTAMGAIFYASAAMRSLALRRPPRGIDLPRLERAAALVERLEALAGDGGPRRARRDRCRPAPPAWRSTAVVTPPAVSVKMPVVSASSRMPWRISSSVTDSIVPGGGSGPGSRRRARRRGCRWPATWRSCRA